MFDSIFCVGAPAQVVVIGGMAPGVDQSVVCSKKLPMSLSVAKSAVIRFPPRGRPFKEA